MFTENILLVFKDRKSVTLNNDFWTDKFKTQYKTFQFFINDNLRLTNNKIIEKINTVIEKENIDIILFEGDHAHIIDFNFIKNINNNVKKGIFLGDDMVWHQLNAITAQACDFVFSSCPLSSLNFQEIGIESLFVPIECNGNILKDYKLQKIYDVLHFGREKTIRSHYINFLRDKGINVKSTGPYDEESDSFEKLAKMINQAKIVLNFSESSNGNRKFNPLRIFKSFYQLKGRIQMAGLANSMCVTQYSPSIYMMYQEDELPSFKTKEECLNKIKFFLENENKLNETKEKFHKKSLMYEDSNYIKKIDAFLKKLNVKKKYHFSEPIWYSSIFLNQSLRLRFKRKYALTFLKEFLEKLTNVNHINFFRRLIHIIFINLLFIRYLPFLLIKITFGYKKKFKNPQETMK